MSGRLDLNGKKNKHTHGIFFFNKDVLLYDDIRKFGYIKILKNDVANKQFSTLGSCSNKIDKIFIDSRGTYVCKKCQKITN
jgi:formamidopyrimidine-DNA glycosylase